MKTHTILYQHLGELSYTEKQPVSVYTGQVDLSEEKNCLYSNDDWRLTPVKKYAVKDVELPDWMSPEEWLYNCNYLKWHRLWSFRGTKELPETWQRKLLQIDGKQLTACAKLLTASLRSPFRQSLREQLVGWLNKEENEYPSPFSWRQWESLLRYER